MGKFNDFFRYFKQKKTTEGTKEAISKFNAIDTLISQKNLVIDTENYHVAMLDNLWSMYEDDRLINFCKNLKFYCDMQNAYKGHKVVKKKNLLISLKYENDDVKPFCYFDGKGIIEYTN